MSLRPTLQTPRTSTRANISCRLAENEPDPEGPGAGLRRDAADHHRARSGPLRALPRTRIPHTFGVRIQDVGSKDDELEVRRRRCTTALHDPNLAALVNRYFGSHMSKTF